MMRPYYTHGTAKDINASGFGWERTFDRGDAKTFAAPSRYAKIHDRRAGRRVLNKIARAALRRMLRRLREDDPGPAEETP